MRRKIQTAVLDKSWDRIPGSVSARPFRLALAQRLCRGLPPLIAQTVRRLVYPPAQAYRDDYEFVTRAQTGSVFRGRTSDFHGYPFSVHGYYEWRNWAVALAVCAPGDTILEIGANIGTETIGFSDIVGSAGKVFACEPLPANYAALENALALNQSKNVTLLPFALGSDSGNVEFVTPPNNSESGMGHVLSNGEQSAGERITVEIRPLDSMPVMIGKAKMIFIDAEGFEVAIVNGGRDYIERCTPVVVVEASPQWLARAGASLRALDGALRTLGYEAFAISRLGLQAIRTLDTDRSCNWLCVHASHRHVLKRARKFLRRGGLFPCIAGINPLTRKPQGP